MVVLFSNVPTGSWSLDSIRLCLTTTPDLLNADIELELSRFLVVLD